MAIDIKLAEQVAKELAGNTLDGYYLKKIAIITPKGFQLQSIESEQGTLWYIGQTTGIDIYGLAKFTKASSLKSVYVKLKTFLKPFK